MPGAVGRAQLTGRPPRRVKGVKEDTLNAWLTEIAPQMERIEELLLRDYRLSRAQLDALWTYVGHKGEKGGDRKSLSGAPSGAWDSRGYCCRNSATGRA
jgi:hypothetical protein